MLPIVENLDRALQACHGITAFSLPPSAHEGLLRDFTEDTLESMKIVQETTAKMDESSTIDYCTRQFHAVKEFFNGVFKPAHLKIFVNDTEKIWQLFLDRYHIRTMHLRASLQDIHECFDIPYLASVFHKPPNYFYRLPLTAELIIGPTPEGLSMGIEIPARLLFLDTLLMY